MEPMSTFSRFQLVSSSLVWMGPSWPCLACTVHTATASPRTGSWSWLDTSTDKRKGGFCSKHGAVTRGNWDTSKVAVQWIKWILSYTTTSYCHPLALLLAVPLSTMCPSRHAGPWLAWAAACGESLWGSAGLGGGTVSCNQPRYTPHHTTRGPQLQPSILSWTHHIRH